MKITNRNLKTIGVAVFTLGVVISMFFKEIQNYIIIGSAFLGMIIMMPWVKEKEKESESK